MSETNLSAKRGAVVSIQRAWRGFVARAIFSCFHYEAVFLQAHIRGYVLRTSFLRARSAVVVLQSYSRMVLSKKRYAQHCAEAAEKREAERAFQAAKAEVKLLLSGHLPTLQSAGICLHRLVTKVAQLGFETESEQLERGDALETYRQVRECYPLGTII